MVGSRSEAPDPALVRELLRFGTRIRPAELFPTVFEEAAALATSDPFAFILAACLDRMMRSKIVWTIPYELRNRLGHLDPHRIAAMKLEDLEGALRSLPRQPRFMNDAPRTVNEIATIVANEHHGDAAGIWRGKDAASVRASLLRVHGVGPQLAEMTLLLIVRAFPEQLAEGTAIDIKADVHTMRVLYRLGVAPARRPEAATRAARLLNPSSPGTLDAPLWIIGQRWCHATAPDCAACRVSSMCRRQGVGTGERFSDHRRRPPCPRRSR